jgi:hypothetical protein
MNAELFQHVARLYENVEKMRDRRALISADIRDAGLQQRLRYAENAFAIKGLAIAEPQALNFRVKETSAIIRIQVLLRRAVRLAAILQPDDELLQDFQETRPVARADDPIEIAVVPFGADGQFLQ